ncbi:uracil-DNA glycosylase [Pacificimonas flava]|uniref:Type-5 uracil-DNA glycosylase n=2 Tax=Pacificimonas TaxID=1960290 RepID=A0A219B0R7_9SPHN|nr:MULTISPECIES: uracil-DNA glycosylase [Pacificimonas]MBZ6379804.1 uracil-DNA glycosylase [Pacificimonas aurantium]OWV31743.1 uracil-DNA glycosylase [Pacificimonas flava]
MPSLSDIPQPPMDCPLCPRLVAFREEQRERHPDWHNNPVEGWGDPDAWLCLVGLAPGLRGANATGRPFTGDWAGDLLFATLDRFGLSEGSYEGRPDDGYRLKGAFISNAVRCVPPQNKPTPEEMRTCRPFLDEQLEALTGLRVLIALGQIAHQSTLKSYGLTMSRYKFGHGARFELPDGRILIDSYHCSRYNTNTGRLTPEMFADVFHAAEAARSA